MRLRLDPLRLLRHSAVPAALAFATATGAQGPSPAAAVGPPAERRGGLEPPLDRRIVVHLRDVSLREALDRVAVAAHLRLSYSAELVPLNRSVTASFDSVAVGEVLVQLLQGVAVSPVVAGPDQVVLAPARPPPAGSPAAAARPEPDCSRARGRDRQHDRIFPAPAHGGH